MKGDTVIAKILKAEGVEWMACFPAQTLIDQAAREGIRPILSRQERAGVNMADGFSRVKNGKTVGVFTMQHVQEQRTPSVGWRRLTRTLCLFCCCPAASCELAWECARTSSRI